MTTLKTLLRYVSFFHAAALWLLFQRCCAMSTFYTLLRYDYLIHAAPLCLLFQRCCAIFILFPWCSTIYCDSTMTTFSTLLRYDYVFNTAALCLPYSRCCAMTTFSIMLHYVSFFHAAVLWLLFKRCCAMSTSSMMPHYDYFFHAAALWLFFSRRPTMSTFSIILHYVFFFHAAARLSTVSILLMRYVYFFQAAALCLLFPRCSTKTTFMRWARNFRPGGGGVQVNPTKKALTTFFFSPHLILQKSNVYFQRKLSFFKVQEGVQLFPGGGGGSNFFQGGVQLLIPYRTPYDLWFSRGVRNPLPPPPPLDPPLTFPTFPTLLWYVYFSMLLHPPPPTTIPRSAHTLQFYNLCTFTIFSWAGLEENTTIGIPIVLAQLLAPPIHFFT